MFQQRLERDHQIVLQLVIEGDHVAEPRQAGQDLPDLFQLRSRGDENRDGP